MLPSLLPLAVAGLMQLSSVSAQGATCALDKLCPENLPCCSQYGVCGVGAYCLGGCDPRMSFSLDSCTPAPTCKSKKYPMNSLNGLASIDEYLGDASKSDWVYQGEPALFGSNVIMTMPPRSVGTVIASTAYLWYGSVKAKMKTSIGRGVVTAFILFSDVKDEIDYEWVGVDLEVAQTNYYFQGIPKYDQSGNITGLSNTYDNWHEYEIKWSYDKIEWFVDGKLGRTKERKDTWNASANQWDFPQTPSRVQFSIWPGGADTNLPGTIQWAGGPIDWNSDYIKQNGYYFATIGEVEVNCYQTNSPPGTNKGTSYWYNNIRATNDTVVDGDKKNVLASRSATGRDMNAGYDKSKDGASVPGGSSSGPGQNPGGNADGSGGDQCSATTFSQDCSGKKNAATGLEQSVFAISALAIVAGAALAWL